MSSSVEAVAMPPRSAPFARRALDAIRHRVLGTYAMLVLAYLFLPIAVVIAFSFNAPVGRFNYTWHSFTWDNWAHPFAVPGIGSALRLSLEIALISSVAATMIGAMMALGLMRHRFRGRGLINTLIFVPMTTPEIVMGSSLLTLFFQKWPLIGYWPLGFPTILIAHVMFNISYVVVTVRARLAGFDSHLEEAAQDLGAGAWTTFWKITLPLIAPGVLAAGLLAFALSLDDFVITYFNSGSTVTFPLFVWGAARVAAPPQINVIGTLIFVVAVGLAATNVVLGNRRAKRASAPAA